VIDGATPQDACVLCRVDSTERGQQDARRGPLAVVRATTSPAALYGYCLGRLPDVVELDDDLGALATQAQRDLAAAVRRSGARPDYSRCPSWRAEQDNRQAAKLADQPGKRRTHAT
jgi:hypothetical protein